MKTSNAIIILIKNVRDQLPDAKRQEILAMLTNSQVGFHVVSQIREMRTFLKPAKKHMQKSAEDKRQILLFENGGTNVAQ